MKDSKSSHNTIRNYYQERRLFKRGLIIISLLLALLIIVIMSRLFQLQIIDHHTYSTFSENNILTVKPLPPKRGVITDRRGRLLADNKPVYTLMVTPDETKNLNQTIQNIQKIIPIQAHDLSLFYQSLTRHRQSDDIALEYNISEKDADAIYLHHYHLMGVHIEPDLKRIYPYNNATSHVVGYVGRITAADTRTLQDVNYAASNFIGRTGIEKYFEKKLHGQVGVTRSEVNASGQIVNQLAIKPAVAGKNIALSIDVALQEKAIQIMGKRVGAIVAIDPRSGEVITMVSTPTFNPNNFVTGLSQNDFKKVTHDSHYPLLNRAIHGDFSPGSTIKPFYSFYALSHHLIQKTDTVYDPGWFKLPHSKHVFHDDLPGDYGYINITKAIILSSDTYFYELANALGIRQLDNALHLFGFGKTTGIELPNEAKGLVPSPDWKKAIIGYRWYTGDTINAGIGQGYVLMTPLQLAAATAMIADRGIRYQPTLLKLSDQALKIKKGLLANKTSLIDPATQEAWNTVIQAMQGVILNPKGTGWRFGRQAPYSVAAKTGTVQVHGHCSVNRIINSASLPESLRCNEMFIAFAPVKHPEIAIAVVVEHGSSASLIARQFLDAYFALQKRYAHAKT